MVARRHIASRTRLVGYGGKDFTLEKANAHVEQAIAKGDWMVVMIHGIREGYDAFGDPGVFEQHLDFLAANADRVVVDTFANLACYAAERDSARLASEKLDGGVRLTLSARCDDRRRVPLTVVVPAPGAREAKAVRRDDGTPLRASVAGDSIRVEAPPDGKPFDVRW